VGFKVGCEAVVSGSHIRGCIQKSPDWSPGARTSNGTAICNYVQMHRYFVSQSREFAAITLFVASQRVFIIDV
jgi:hypothetical protein